MGEKHLKLQAGRSQSLFYFVPQDSHSQPRCNALDVRWGKHLKLQAETSSLSPLRPVPIPFLATIHIKEISKEPLKPDWQETYLRIKIFGWINSIINSINARTTTADYCAVPCQGCHHWPPPWKYHPNIFKVSLLINLITNAILIQYYLKGSTTNKTTCFG